MNIASEIITILGLSDEYSLFAYFIASLIFVFIMLQFLNVLVCIFKWIGGYR